MEQSHANALRDAALERANAELERSKCLIAALQAELNRNFAERKVVSMQSKSRLSKLLAPPLAPPLAGRTGSDSGDDDDENASVAVGAKQRDGAVAGARAGVPGGGSGIRGLAAASGGVALRERDVRALLREGVNAPPTRDENEPTPHAPRAVSGAGRPVLPAARPRTEAAGAAVGAAASGGAVTVVRTGPSARTLQDFMAGKEAAVAAVRGYIADKKTGELVECGRILLGCLIQTWGVVFSLPVDPVADDLPDYADIVEQPMDFTTIVNRLISNAYENGLGFKLDMELVFANCMRYNKSTEPVFQAAAFGQVYFTRLAQQFLRKYYAPPEPAKPARARAPKRPRADASKRTDADGGGSGGAAGEEEQDVVRAAKRSAKCAAEMVATARARVDGAAAGFARPSPAKKAASCAVSSPKKQQKLKEPTSHPPRPPIPYKYKKALAAALANLPIARQVRVTQIIQSTFESQDDEVVIDLDMLDNETLWRLVDYCFPGNKREEILAAAAEASAAAAAKKAAADKAKAAPAAASTSSSSDSDSDSDSDSSSESDSSSDEDAPAAPSTLPNAAAWASFAASEPQDKVMTESAGGESQAAGMPFDLWDEFAAKEAARQARRKDDEAAETTRAERERAAAAKSAADAAATEAERERIRAAEAAEAAAAAAAAAATREAAKAAMAAELAAVSRDVNLDEQADMMREMEMQLWHQQEGAHVPVEADGMRRIPDTSRPSGAGGGTWLTVM
jgi:hypothetical protein